MKSVTCIEAVGHGALTVGLAALLAIPQKMVSALLSHTPDGEKDLMQTLLQNMSSELRIRVIKYVQAHGAKEGAQHILRAHQRREQKRKGTPIQTHFHRSSAIPPVVASRSAQSVPPVTAWTRSPLWSVPGCSFGSAGSSFASAGSSFASAGGGFASAGGSSRNFWAPERAIQVDARPRVQTSSSQIASDPQDVADAVAVVETWERPTPVALKALQDLFKSNNVGLGDLIDRVRKSGQDTEDLLELKQLRNSGSLCYANALVQALRSVILTSGLMPTNADASGLDSRLWNTLVGSGSVSDFVQTVGFPLDRQRDPVDLLRAIEGLPVMRRMMWRGVCESCPPNSPCLEQLKLEERKPITVFPETTALPFSRAVCPNNAAHSVAKWEVPEVVFQCFEQSETRVTPRTLASLGLDRATVNHFLEDTPFCYTPDFLLNVRTGIQVRQNGTFVWQGREIHEEGAKDTFAIDIFAEDKKRFDPQLTQRVVNQLNRVREEYQYASGGSIILREKVHVQGTQFRLRAAVIHKGADNAGHYYTLRKYAGQTVVLNDSHAVTSRDPFILLPDETPRILVYQRC
ncbi:hypothetical protein GNI_105710 [Gregarina niphandrodes]|uniref:Ubiquitin carboxyl-terminal hydrolase n=1 Tax=Gregarina niphandrodes TaxID=110365 RepID=A0A023B4A8_GRENI|nr:hypothetical protein GNI_105710 [Gregarina niphandrodes]EZG56111.1 hypothetical protein GNI_105710 [Gregarina niphandrodes]|eukprot:XP_011131344.1 hypothetical protein GNI_105710 [Gregarina niphandrodes]